MMASGNNKIKTENDMKRIIIGILAVSAMLCGCQKNEIATPSAENAVLYATIEENNETKTYMDANNNIRWSEGDQIVGFMKSSLGLKYQILPSSVGKTSASFENISGSNGNINAGTEWDHNVVYYPYSDAVEAEKSGSNYAIDVVLPSEQVYAQDSFGNGAMAMVAVSEDNNITFRNVLGGMKLQLRGTQKVVSVTLQGKNSEKLSGAATVTAYTDETKPAITMASGASASVTLNCGSGVQLNESTATEFILALPPVLFSKGFTVTVTDSDSKTYTVETDKANTVLRSSLLTMPAFKLGENPGSGSTEKTVFLNITSLTLAPSTSYALTAEVEPMSGDQSVVWSSSSSSVATVDGEGKVTAVSDGTAVISAVSGGASASCTVTVISCRSDAIEYVVDGVSYGKGIAIGDVIWAPVNCGYKAATAESKGFPYGKLYQWGRKYGQGYSTEYDESVPDIVEGPLDFANAVREKYSNTFFTNSSFPYDWVSPQDDELWNSGTESAPVKTKYDPCPTGWRVPTYAELDGLSNNYSSWTTVDGQKGRYFAGDYTYLADAPQVFFPAAGDNYYGDGHALNRGIHGFYWSSRLYGSTAYHFGFDSSSTGMNRLGRRSYGYSVRCVQE